MLCLSEFLLGSFPEKQCDQREHVHEASSSLLDPVLSKIRESVRKYTVRTGLGRLMGKPIRARTRRVVVRIRNILPGFWISCSPRTSHMFQRSRSVSLHSKEEPGRRGPCLLNFRQVFQAALFGLLAENGPSVRCKGCGGQCPGRQDHVALPH